MHLINVNNEKRKKKQWKIIKEIMSSELKRKKQHIFEDKNRYIFEL